MGRRLLAVAGGGGMLMLVMISPQIGAALGPPSAGSALAMQDGAAPAEVPADYAAATFGAWLEGDEAALRQRAQPAVAELLLARAPGDADPGSEPQCEGAAGSTYCSWALADLVQLQLRVDNAAASAGSDLAVFEAAFVPVPPSLAVWPTGPGGFTHEVAEDQQASVDEGHSPWLLSPEAVIVSYADVRLGWPEDTVEVEATDDPAAFRLVNTTIGTTVDVTLSQPARQGEGGIWVITRAGASESAPEQPTPPDELTPPEEPTPPVETPPARPIPGAPDFTG